MSLLKVAGLSGEHGQESHTHPKHSSVLSGEPREARHPWSTWDDTRTRGAEGPLWQTRISNQPVSWTKTLSPSASVSSSAGQTEHSPAPEGRV